MAALWYALLADAAIETWWSGSPARWWIAGGAIACLAASGLSWSRTSWATKAWASGSALMTMVALTAWLPEGTSHGVRLAGLTTGRLLSLIAAGGVVVAAAALLRAPLIPRAAAWVIAGAAAYGTLAFVYGAIADTPFSALLAGESLWRSLPLVLQGTVIGGLVVLPLGLVASTVAAGLRNPAPGTRARAVRQAAAIATTLATVIAAFPQRDGAASAATAAAEDSQRTDLTRSAATSPERLATLDNSLRAIEDGLRELPRDRWDPDYVVQQVGTDPQRLFEWVRDHTSWIPYRGVLRGPVGVLNDRLGNSLDRAVLVATLLEKAGHVVRLARRELGVEEGLELTAWAVTGSSPDEPPTEVDESESQPPQAGIPAIATLYQLDAASVERTLSDRARAIDALISDLDTRVEDQVKRLLGTLRLAPAEEEWNRRIEAAMAAVRDHWWVQRRDGATWVDLDLLRPDGASGGPGVVPDETVTLAEIAPRHHELAVRVVAEQWSAGAITERYLLEHVLRPAETIGQPVVLQFWPSDWRTEEAHTPSARQASFRAVALDQRQWDVALTIAGRVVAQGGVAASGGSAGAPKGGATGALAGRLAQSLSSDSDASGGALTAVWVEYEIRSPADPPRRIRREVFDVLGPAARAAKAVSLTLDDARLLTRSLSLMTRTELLPINCAFAPEYVADLAGHSLMADRELIRAALRGDVAPGSGRTEQLLNDAAPALTPLYSLALARLEWTRSSDRIFIDRLNLVARHRYFASTRDGLVVRDATDIVANEVGVDLAVRDALAIRVEQGVFDTNAERALQAGGRAIGNTAEAFATSSSWVTLRSRDNIARLAVSEDALRRIAADLDGGYAVVAPTAPVALGPEMFVGWWRVDAVTGDTLGVAANGWGQDMAERGVQYNVFREMASRFVFDHVLCRAIPPAAKAADMPIVKELFPVETPEEASRGCLISAMVSGAFFATLPLLLVTLKYTGRLAGSLGRSILAPRGPRFPRWGPKPPGRPPRPPARPGAKPFEPAKVPPC